MMCAGEKSCELKTPSKLSLPGDPPWLEQHPHWLVARSKHETSRFWCINLSWAHSSDVISVFTEYTEYISDTHCTLSILYIVTLAVGCAVCLEHLPLRSPVEGPSLLLQGQRHVRKACGFHFPVKQIASLRKRSGRGGVQETLCWWEEVGQDNWTISTPYEEGLDMDGSHQLPLLMVQRCRCFTAMMCLFHTTVKAFLAQIYLFKLGSLERGICWPLLGYN